MLSFALALLQASVAYDYAPMAVPEAALGVAVFGVPVLMIVAASLGFLIPLLVIALFGRRI